MPRETAPTTAPSTVARCLRCGHPVDDGARLCEVCDTTAPSYVYPSGYEMPGQPLIRTIVERLAAAAAERRERGDDPPGTTLAARRAVTPAGFARAFFEANP